VKVSVSNRIVLGFAAITGLLILLGVYAVGQVGEVRSTIDTIVSRDLKALAQLDKVQDAQTKMVEYRTAAVRQSLVGISGTDGDPAERWREQVQAAQDGLAGLREMVIGFQQVSVSGERTQLWHEMEAQVIAAEQSFARVRPTVQGQLSAMKAGDRTAMLASEPTIAAERRDIVSKTFAIRETLQRAVKVGQEAGEHVYERSRVSIMLCILAAVALSIFVAWAIRRSVIGPLGGFMDLTEKVGAGDLTTTAATGSDELGRLGVHLNEMVEGLRGLARQRSDFRSRLNPGAGRQRRGATRGDSGNRRDRRRDHAFWHADQPPGAGRDRRRAGDGADDRSRYGRDRRDGAGDGSDPSADRDRRPKCRRFVRKDRRDRRHHQHRERYLGAGASPCPQCRDRGGGGGRTGPELRGRRLRTEDARRSG
jgi:HAMP domain-containing protein